MKITCISDLHGEAPDLPGGDLLIVAGDLTGNDSLKGWNGYFKWLKAQNYRKKVFIAGNHDGFLKSVISTTESKAMQLWRDEGFEYLFDSGTEFEGLKIWGAPWTPEFCDWHFMLPRGPALKEKWDLIPNDTDILITHGPAYGILDGVARYKMNIEKVGCEELRKAVERIKPKLHVFGHLHLDGCQKVLLKNPGYGDENNTLCVNAAFLDDDYIARPIESIITVEL